MVATKYSENEGKESGLLSGENLSEVPRGGHLGPYVAEKRRGLCKGPGAAGRPAPARNRSGGSEAGL